MSAKNKKVLQTLNPKKIWIPAVISLAFVAYMIITNDDFSPEKLSLIFQADSLPLFLAGATLVIKELAYIYRIKFLSGNQLSFTASTYIIMLWEFASAVTPSVVGGTPVAVFLLMKEGISVGKSLALAMVTAIFDNLYLVILGPVIYLFYREDLFNFIDSDSFERSLPTVFGISYSLIVAYTAVMIFAVFFKPRLFKWILIKITSIRPLRKWRYSAYQYGNEILVSSNELRGKNFKYFWQITYTTFISWTARFALLNFMIEAYIHLSIGDHFLSFSKHIVLWVMMLVSPTPGSSGAAELGFSALFQSSLEEFTAGITLMWRTFSYYPFLIIGAFVIPRWVNRIYFKKKSKSDESH